MGAIIPSSHCKAYEQRFNRWEQLLDWVTSARKVRQTLNWLQLSGAVGIKDINEAGKSALFKMIAKASRFVPKIGDYAKQRVLVCGGCLKLRLDLSLAMAPSGVTIGSTSTGALRLITFGNHTHHLQDPESSLHSLRSEAFLSRFAAYVGLGSSPVSVALDPGCTSVIKNYERRDFVFLPNVVKLYKHELVGVC